MLRQSSVSKEGVKVQGSEREEDLRRGRQSASGALGSGPAKGTEGLPAKASLWGLSERRRPRLGVATHSFSSAQRSAWGRGRRGNSCQGSSGPSPARPAHREGVVYVEGNLPPLEGELLLPVPAHCHQSRHRPRRCRCHRHHLLPAAAAAAAAAPAAAASSQLLPATAKPRERKHPPPRSTFATGGRGGGAEQERTGEPRCVSHHPIPHALGQSVARSTGTRPLAPPALPHPPLRPPAGLQSGSKGEAERTCWPRDVPAQPRSRGSRSSFPPRLHSPCPHPAADPLPPLGAPRPGGTLGCSCPAPPRPWEGSTPPRLCRVRGWGQAQTGSSPGSEEGSWF